MHSNRRLRSRYRNILTHIVGTLLCHIQFNKPIPTQPTSTNKSTIIMNGNGNNTNHDYNENHNTNRGGNHMTGSQSGHE